MTVTTEDLAGLHADHGEPHGEPQALPLVLVHGLWADAWVWHRWLAHAAGRGWDTWAVHLRGRSGSRPVDDLGRVRVQDLVRDVRDVLDAVGPAVMVGHSLGGLVAQVAAAQDSRIRALALVCSIPPRGILAVTGPLLRRAPRLVPAIVGSRTFAPRRDEARDLICNASPANVLDQYMENVVQDSGTVARQILLGAVGVDARAIACPVLVVGAREDRISPPSVQPKLARKYGAELKGFAGLDHLHMVGPHWQAPADAVLDWAEKNTGLR